MTAAGHGAFRVGRQCPSRSRCLRTQYRPRPACGVPLPPEEIGAPCRASRQAAWWAKASLAIGRSPSGCRARPGLDRSHRRGDGRVWSDATPAAWRAWRTDARMRLWPGPGVESHSVAVRKVNRCAVFLAAVEPTSSLSIRCGPPRDGLRWVRRHFRGRTSLIGRSQAASAPGRSDLAR